jgi:hypothetical protein
MRSLILVLVGGCSAAPASTTRHMPCDWDRECGAPYVCIASGSSYFDPLCFEDGTCTGVCGEHCARDGSCPGGDDEACYQWGTPGVQDVCVDP